uniref:NACHT domain-containing protein n=1 Tax=Cyprinus carpio TaxID=7962 RepID=A0A8C1UVF9_CYPCA
MKAKSILKDQKEHSCKYLDDNVHVNFSFIPLVLERNPVAKTPQCKIKSKNKKCKKLRPKKLRAYIPNEEQALSPVDLLKWQDKNILIIGKPGVGKTTVVQEMLRLWSEKDGREIDYMFYFDESVLAHSSNIASLQSILFDVYLKPMENDRMDVFKDIEENSENVVLILDGVTDFGKHSILWKIMNHELLPDAKIVITCRSEVEYDPLFRKWPTQKVYVQGFSKESINTYYHTMLGHDPVLLEVVLKNQELFSLSHVPLYASMIVDLMQFKNGTVCDHPHTVTEMYIHIFRAAVKKQIQQIDKYLKEIKDQVYYLMENAFNATMQKTLNVISCDETDISRAFLKMITIRDSPTSAMTYCAFLHNTMQEFFSALWLLGHPDEIEKVLQLCQTEEHKHMRHVLPFLCGLLSEHNIRLLKCLFPEDQIKKTSDWFIEKLLDTFLQPQSEESEDSEEFDLLFVSQCLYELQSPKACLMFLEKMDHQLEPEEDLDPHQCCALSYVIAQSRDKEVYLNLEDCTIADVGMNMMLSCSPNIRLNICKEPLEQATFFLEFFHKASQCCCSFFDQRYNYNHEPLNALLDLCSHVKNYETQTGRSFLPALQSVFQSAPDVWIIDLSRRKSSVLLEVLKLQTEKKPVELIGCSEEESEVMSFLQCLPYISQLRISHLSERVQKRLLLELFIKAAEIETQTGEQMLKLLTSGFIYSFFPYRWTFSTDWSDFLLIFYSHVKDYETQTGRSLLPALQSVFQSTPDVWIIDLSQRKSSVLLEVLKLQTEKKPVELRGCSEEESEVMSLLQCLPYISQLRFYLWNGISAAQFVLKLFIKAAEIERQTGEQMLKLLSSVCTYSSFPYERTYRIKQSDFLLDLCSHVKDYETQTGWIFLPALQKVFQSAPDVWIIDFSQRKSSVLLEVLKLRTENKPVELFECSEEESEMMSFLQCLPYISQLRFFNLRKSFHNRFLLKLFIKAAEIETQTGEQMLKLLSSVCTYSSFPYKSTDIIKQVDFLLDLCSHVKDYETQTGRSLLPGLQSVFQLPDVWIIDLSQRKSSVLLEVLKLQTEKKPVELIRCSEEESEMISLLQCLPYISQLSFEDVYNQDRRMSAVRFLLNLSVAAVDRDKDAGTRFSTLSSMCSYKTFPFMFDEYDHFCQSGFLLDLCSHVKNYETQTGRSLLPGLQSVFQLPDIWIIDLSQRKSSVLLEVLKLQTEKKPVELLECSEQESEVMSFLQCLPYISQLSFGEFHDKERWMSAVRFLLNLSVAAVESDTDTGTRFTTLSSVCSYKTFPLGFDEYDPFYQSDFLLDLYSHVKNYETQTGRSLLPGLQSIFQSAPDVWIIDLSQRKSSALLEVLKLQTEKKPVELFECSEEESEVMSFLQCLPFISQLRFERWNSSRAVQFVQKLFIKAAEIETQTVEQMLKLLSSVCTYSSFPYKSTDRIKQSDFLLDLYSHVKDYETQTGRSLLPGLQSVFQLPDVWIIDLSRRKSSVLLEVLKLQTEKKPVELIGCSEEESEVMSFLQCLPFISQLRYLNFWIFTYCSQCHYILNRFMLQICFYAKIDYFIMI